MKKVEATAEQIAAWKKKHGDVFAIVVFGENDENHTCYVRKPTRNEMGLAAKLSTSNPMKYPEVILNACFLGGDEEIKTDDELFLSAAGQIDKLVKVREAEVKKL
jgi:hypothetical protein